MSANNTTASKDILEQLFEAFNRHDLDGVLALMTDDIVFEGAAGNEAYGARFSGHDEVGKAFSGVWQTFPDVQWANHSHFAADGLGVSQWTLVGTREDGKRIEADGVDLFTFRDGKIASKKAFRKERPLLG
ncbi:MAG: nuclear transport factor 2 family protein [Gammaproteobacteria bacterium]|nr:nuclear transport factor 2 family protein [Gammaproteobacteria bacterium]